MSTIHIFGRFLLLHTLRIVVRTHIKYRTEVGTETLVIIVDINQQFFAITDNNNSKINASSL